jgi:ribosomal protein S14
LDNFKRHLFIKNEIQLQLLTAYKKTATTGNIFRAILNLDRKNLTRFSSKIQQSNRCVLSGRKRSVSKLTRMSRFRFQSMAYEGKLPGFMRSS